MLDEDWQISFDYLRHCGYHQIVDDIAGEEEGVDEAAILVTKSLSGNSWLCGVGTGEGEEYCKYPESID